jgi:hypothetical protein
MGDRFDEYKARLEMYGHIADLKEKVQKTVAEKRLCSVMNDTKWLELQDAVYELPFLPPNIVKCVTYDDEYPIGQLLDAPTYIGDWSSFWEEGLPEFFTIEWMRVRPRHGKHRGRLVDPEILDETREFEAILKRLHIPHEEQDGTFTIYGYR